MRGAGCTYNDIVDHDIDMEVARTRSRPLAIGPRLPLSGKGLHGAAGTCRAGGAAAVQRLSTIWLGILSLGLVAIYPFAKRFTDWPQFFLGLAFSWGAIMGWSAEFGTLSFAPVLLYGAAIAWTIGYDTIYAYQDREDDELIGVRLDGAPLRRQSTPLADRPLWPCASLLMLLAFLAAGAGLFAYLGLLIAAVLLIYQILVLNIHDPSQCLALFKFNGVVGLIIFAGLVAALLVRLI